MNRVIAIVSGAVLALATAPTAQEKPAQDPPLEKVKKARKAEKEKGGEEKAKKLEKKLPPGFGDLQEKMEKVLERLDAFGGTPRGWRFFPSDKTFGGREGVKIKVDSQGVEVEVTEEKDGKKEVKKYRADSLEEFRRQYPEVARRFRLDGRSFGFRFGLSPRQLPDLFDLERRMEALRRRLDGLDPRRGFHGAPGRGRWWGGPSPVDPLPPAKDGGDDRGRLGIFVEEVSPQLARYLELEPGVGFLVQRVQPGSLAEAAGVRAGDLVHAVNGKVVRGIPSIRRALLAEEGDTVTITVLRKGRKIGLETDRPEEERKEPQKPVKLKRL
jgi:hypothetical protein